MTAHQAVLAVIVPTVVAVLILAVPAIRRRRAQSRRAFAWFRPAGQRCDCCWPLEDLTGGQPEPVPDLSTPDAVAPLAARLAAMEDQRLTDWEAFDAHWQEMREVDGHA